jgi:hypothetical protein
MMLGIDIHAHRAIVLFASGCPQVQPHFEIAKAILAFQISLPKYHPNSGGV